MTRGRRFLGILMLIVVVGVLAACGSSGTGHAASTGHVLAA
jgi:hypothetical protein